MAANEKLASISKAVALVVHEEIQRVEAEMGKLRDEITELRARLDAGALDVEMLTEQLKAELAERQATPTRPTLKLIS